MDCVVCGGEVHPDAFEDADVPHDPIHTDLSHCVLELARRIKVLEEAK
jgi:hypothetical protein